MGNFADDAARRPPIQYQSLRFSIAALPSEHLAVTALVEEVYREALGLTSREPHAPPPTPDTRVGMVHRGSTLCATLTMQGRAFARSSELPLELDARYDLDSLGIPRVHLVEVRRVAARRGDKDAVRCLYQGAARYCAAFGATHWLGLVEAGDGVDASDEVYGALHARGLTVEPPPLAPRFESATHRLLHAGQVDVRWIAQTHEAPQRPLAFARDIGARVVGVPTVHPHYTRLVVPMLAPLPTHERTTP